RTTRRRRDRRSPPAQREPSLPRTGRHGQSAPKRRDRASAARWPRYRGGRGCGRERPRRRQCPPRATDAEGRPRASFSGLPLAEGIAAISLAEWLRQHMVEALLGGVTKLLDANRHAQLSGGGLGAIGAEQSIPPRQIEAEIGVGLFRNDGVMDAVHVGR